MFSFVIQLVTTCCYCRRKMNRIAAQNARDRRKDHMESIEQKLAVLEKQVNMKYCYY